MADGAQITTGTAGKASETTRANAGNILVNVAEDVTLKGGSQFRSDTFGEGDAGDITINAGGAVTFDGVELINNQPVESGAASQVAVDPFASSLGIVGKGQGGDITIIGKSITLRNGARLSAGAFSQGDAGKIFLQATDSLVLEGNRTLEIADNLGNLIPVTFSSRITTNVGAGAVGKGGDVDLKVTSGSLTMADGAQITTGTAGEGGAGNITINAGDAVSFEGVSEGFSTGLFASTERGASGPAGNIIVTTPDFRLSDGAVINTLTANDGKAGNITINAKTFEVTGGGQVITSTRSSGEAGSITLNITDSLFLSGKDTTFADRLARFGEDVVNNQDPASGLYANTAEGSTGKGGSIFIDSPVVFLDEGARISVNSQGQGNGGSIFLSAENLTLDSGSAISAATASGEGGNITLQISELLRLRQNSPISATAGGTGNGGNITINTDFLVASDKSDITANAFQGRGGNISIAAQGIFLSPDSNITASSELGIEGVVEIDTPENDPSRGLVELPETFVDPRQLIAQNACRQGAKSEFLITGRGGLPSTPEQLQHSDEVEVGLVEPALDSAAPVTPPPVAAVIEEIVPARGWIRNDKGEVVLVGYDPTASGVQRQEPNLGTCQPR
jgi:large exoprotein involved in heme utilization and adhesion